jgi:hypothetical protein
MTKMTNKKIRNTVAREFRKLTKRDFINCKELAKVFLRHEEWRYSDKNYKLGFCYEHQFDGKYDDLNYQGLCKKGGSTFFDTVDIPYRLYELRDVYLKQSGYYMIG